MNIPSLAVIGLGFGKKHATMIESKQVNAKLAAVADLNPDFMPFANELGVPFYNDFREMIEKERPDGVIIAVPPEHHATIGLACIELGVHLLVEKPITYTLEEADVLIAAAERAGVILEIGQQHRFDTGVELAKQQMKTAAFGQLVGFHVFSTLYKADDYFKKGWRNKRQTAGGPLISNGIHDVDRIRYLCGEIETVSALMSNSYRKHEVEDTVAVSIKCMSGAVGTFFISDCSHVAIPYTDFYYGSGETIMFNCSSMYSADDKNLFRQVHWEHLEKSHPSRNQIAATREMNIVDNHIKELQHFARVIQGLAQPRTDGPDGKKSLEVLLAIIESVTTQQTVKLG